MLLIDEDQTTQTSVPSGSAGSSIKVTLKKTRSSSSSSSKGSAHSFEVSYLVFNFKTYQITKNKLWCFMKYLGRNYEVYRKIYYVKIINIPIYLILIN